MSSSDSPFVSGRKAATKMTARIASAASSTITHAKPNLVFRVGNHWTITKFASQFTLAQVAKDAGLSRESLYRALSEKGNPSFATVLKVARALGVRFHADAA